MLRKELGDAVFYGDACEIRTMVRVGMERADLVIAVTGDDEDNLIICQVAKRWFDVPRTIARINNPRNEEIFRMLEIDETISATTLLFQLIEQEVAVGEFLPLTLLRKGRLEILEMVLPPTSPMANKPIGELTLPTDCLLVAVVRGDSAKVVTGDTILQVGDTVIALATPEALEQLHDIVSQKK
ncbi:MAG: potassium channel family protein [Armatimonadota bacterium]